MSNGKADIIDCRELSSPNMIQELDPDREMPFYIMDVEEALKNLDVNIRQGLTSAEAAARTEKYGPNLLPAEKPKTSLEILWEQINSVLIYCLIVGAAVSFGFNHMADGIVIIAVVVINVIVGFYMEGKAEDTTKKLKSMMSPSAQVIRNEERIEIEASQITIGDVFFLQPGDVVPADGRVLTAFDLHIMEAPLTGESHAVVKSPNTLPKADVPLAERTCMVYSGTQVIKGSATCVAVHIGKNCEIGKISGLLTEVENQKTPLVIQLERFALYLSFAIITIACIALGVASARGYDIADAFSFAIGIAVAAIPEGLPSCVTITFAIGVNIMSGKGAIIKSLPAVETLGSVGVICSDKTGTLTQNQMTVKAICAPQVMYALTDGGNVRKARNIDGTGEIPEADDLTGYMFPGIFCNDSTVLINEVNDGASNGYGAPEEELMAPLKPSEALPPSPTKSPVPDPQDVEKGPRGPKFSVQGDPTEACMLTLASQICTPTRVKHWRKQFERIAEIPFDSATKFMATLHSLPAEMVVEYMGKLMTAEQRSSLASSSGNVSVIFVKGAPEKVLSFTSQSPEANQRWLSNSGHLATKGMRVLGLAFKIVSDDIHLANEMAEPTAFTMAALVGIIDPPRPEAIVAVKHAQEAGITVKMITGDHPVTALAIGKTLGLKTQSDRGAVTGAELDRLLEGEQLDAFDEIVMNNDVFARTTPEHKLRIVQSLQRQGKVCSMTGDGVNDAPALKAANIGVAMGITGTEVAKDAANMIITDDNFATIVDAIRVGRCTYHNLVKILAFVLPTNGGQAFSIIMALIIGLDVPITALQILWVNMVTSITLGLVLAFEQPHPEIMQHPPRKPGKPIFGRFLSWRVLYVSAVLVFVVLGNFQWEKHRLSDIDELRTIAVNTLSAGQLGYLFNCRFLRSNTNPKAILLGNWYVYAGLIAVAGFQAIFTYVSPFQYIFATKALDAQAWGKIVFWGVVVFIVVETEKLIASFTAKVETRARAFSSIKGEIVLEDGEDTQAYEEL